MVHLPVLGIRFLTRAGLLIAAAAAVPIVLKKCRPLAEKVGDTLIKTGEKLKEGPNETSSAQPSPKTKAPDEAAAPSKAASARASKPKTARKTASKAKRAGPSVRRPKPA